MDPASTLRRYPRKRRPWLRVLAVALALFVSVEARAQQGGTRLRGQPAPSLWRHEWPTFGWAEGAATVAAGVGTAILALESPPTQPKWRGGILFDDAVRDSVRLSSPGARKTARRVGDMPYYAAGLLPLIVDPLLVAGLGRGDGKAALNLELVSWEAFSYAGFLSFVSTRLSVRERPDSTECVRNASDPSTCPHDTEAFWSGHTSIVMASAGLVCANHRYMALWGGGLPDVAACAVAGTGAVVTAVSRMMADRHYSTDVLAGTAIGLAAGYGVPTLLHYTRRRSDIVAFVQPELGGGASLRLSGSF